MEVLGAEGAERAKTAVRLDTKTEAGRAYEAWWALRTQFHRFPDRRKQAEAALAALAAEHVTRDLYRARRDWFKTRDP